MGFTQIVIPTGKCNRSYSICLNRNNCTKYQKKSPYGLIKYLESGGTK